jgi:pyruvate dehydrogenase E2 component (dihydrolipoamide acetyltransferase)
MTTEVVMPQMGESLSEGTITKWNKKAGDPVQQDEPLFEITTDEVDTEVPSPVAGVLERILVNEGETIAVGTVVGVLAEGVAAPPSRPEKSDDHDPSPASLREATSPQRGVVGTSGEDRRAHLSPAVVSLAATHRIPLEELGAIRGSGRSGRITKKDVEGYVASGRTSLGVDKPVPVPSSTPARASSPPARYLYQPEPTDKLVPISGMRKQIAEHMIWSQQISAQVTSFTECDVHRIVLSRDERRARFEEAEGVPLTFLPFVAEATVKALKEFGIFNASVVGDQIALKKHIHLGVAVTLEEGLIAPVVRNADEMNFVGLARSIHDLAEKARKRQLVPPDVQGATFTITNPGMLGGLTGTPMIPQPQVAILGMGTVQKKPVVVDDAIAIRPIVVLALTFDHRIIDGATGFQFLERVRSHLEHFDLPRY